MKTSAKMTLGFAIACLMIMIVSVSANISINKSIQESEWTQHTVKVRSLIERMSTDFVTAQNNLRTYHMTRQDYYLDRYKIAHQELQQTLQDLQGQIQGNELQKQNLVAFQTLLNQRIQLWQDSFELEKMGGWPVLQKRLMGVESKDQELQIFKAMNVLKAEEEKIFGEQSERSVSQAQQAKWVVWLSGALACALILAAAYIVNRGSLRREAAEEHIDRFFNLSLDLLCISGMDGYFKRLSPSYEEILGYSLKELYEKPIVDFIHPDDVGRTLSEIESQIRGNKVLSFENRFRRKDGTYCILSWKSVPSGPYMYAVARDVTQQKEFESEILQAREAAQNAARTKSEFLANMSHEIRTPLNGVVGMTDLLVRTKLDAEQKSFVAAIRGSSTILLRIINEILDFSKIEAGRVQLESIDFDLGQLIESQISLIGVLAAEKGLILQSDTDPKIPKMLKGDSGKIVQILLNLLNNAIKFTDEGKIIVRAELLSRTKENCEIKISVQDSGIGISREVMNRLFEPFMQADGSTARKFGGTGLGLSISKRLVEVMNGEMNVESTPGAGSTFWFSFAPEISSLEVSNLEPQTWPLPMVNGDDVAQHQAIRILVAEDNQVNQVIIMNMMKALGYSASLAKNGQEAVNQYNASHFDLILMDQHMPVMDGVQASTEIRKLEESTGRHIPIIAFTATVIQDVHKVEFKSLMDDFLLKPVTMQTLAVMLTKWERQIFNATKAAKANGSQTKSAPHA